jgi:hypothetical protein
MSNTSTPGELRRTLLAQVWARAVYLTASSGDTPWRIVVARAPRMVAREADDWRSVVTAADSPSMTSPSNIGTVVLGSLALDPFVTADMTALSLSITPPPSVMGLCRCARCAGFFGEATVLAGGRVGALVFSLVAILQPSTATTAGNNLGKSALDSGCARAVVRAGLGLFALW